MSAARLLMRQRCSILRKQTIGDSKWGQEGTATWPAIATDVACRLYSPRGTLEQQPEQTEPVTNQRLIVPLGTDLKATDRIGDITDRRGNVTQPGPFTIQGPVERRDDHLALMLRQAS